MKKTITLLLTILSFNCIAQDPQIENMLDDLSIDSLIYYASAISGEFPVDVNGTSETILSRNRNFPGNAVAADYIEQKFQDFGLTTEVQDYSATGENVIAIQPGLIFPNKKVVICGHYDSMPSNGTASPAADDDGSGTAAVIEAARVLSQYNFAYTIVYAAWDEEEYGLVGSNYYATQAETNEDSLVAVINVDAVAWDGDGDKLARVHVRDIANSLTLGTVAANMISTYNIDLQIETNSPGATYSDHASFWNHGFSAILLIEDFDNDGNPHYHTTTDLVEHFDTTYFEQMSKWAFATTATMAVPLSGNVGVSDTKIGSFNIYPNPVTNRLSITSDSDVRTANFNLIDALGKEVKQEQNLSFPAMVDIENLPAGNYFLRLENNKSELLHSQNILKQ
ncbi:MAG: M28 family peptidase [Flavobacteriales bacterium]